MKFLPPQRLRPHYYEGAEKALGDYFREAIFDPLSKILAESAGQSMFANTAPAPSRDLVAALRRGEIQYHDGFITGEFDARLSASLRGIGATFNVSKGAFDRSKPQFSYRLNAVMNSLWLTLKELPGGQPETNAWGDVLIPLLADKAGAKMFPSGRVRNLYSKRNELSNGTIYEWDVEDL